MDLKPKLNIAIAQINPLLGDIIGNTDKIIAHAKQALVEKQCDLIIFPELAITGYPPEDLLLRPECHQRVTQALNTICQADLPGYVIVGHPTLENHHIYNSASLIHGQQITKRYDKQRLPNYSVFDEKRYFTPGHRSPLIDIAGHCFALAICEDLWHPGLMAHAAQHGAQAIICINASPFHLQKPEKRINMMRTRQEQEGKLPIIYNNIIGGQDELIFDGGSFVLNAHGDITAQAAYYAEETIYIDYPNDSPIEVRTRREEEKIYDALVLGTKDYCHKNNFPSAIVGLSGGIDSALTLAIAVDALGHDNVEAVLMPSRYTSQTSIQDAKLIAKNLGTTLHEVSIEPTFQAFLTSLAQEFAELPEDTTEENIQARCRGVILLALSNKFNHLVLTTGNKSELAVGYATLYGDMAGGFAVLKDCLKTQVYQLANYRNQLKADIPQSIIDRAPTAELRADQKDQDSLPPYDILDEIITRHVVKNQCIDSMIKAGLDADLVRKVVKMIERNEYKRRQAPPGIRLSPRAFGRDWRYPITSAFGRQNEKN